MTLRTLCPPAPVWRHPRLTRAAVVRRAALALLLVAPLAASAQRGATLATAPSASLAAALAAPGGSSGPQAAPAAPGLLPTGAFSVGYDAQYRSINVAVDAAGGQHAIWSTQYGASDFPVVYAYCAPGAACESRTAWATTPIGLDDYYFLQLEVTADGRPRVLAHDADLKIPGIPFETQYRYASCESNCLTRASWTTTELWTADNGQGYYASDFQPEFFALDPQGRPRFVYTQSVDEGEAYYAGCDAGCTQRSNWWRRPMPAEGYDDYETADLEIGADGRPRLMFTAPIQGAVWAAYGECTVDCADADAWGLIGIGNISPDGYCGGGTEGCLVSLALDGASRPRIAVQGPNTNIVAAWCQSDCTDGNNWGALGFSGITTGEHPVSGVDPAGRHVIAFQEWTESGGLALAWCESGCEGDDPAWAYETMDASATLQAEFTIPPPSLCLEGDWQVGFRPSLAFRPDGQPVVGHDSEYLMLCSDGDGSWSYEARWRTPRIATRPSPFGVGQEPGAPGATAVRLGLPAPNPTAGAATVAFTLADAGDATVDVVDATGRTVLRAASGAFPAGEHRVDLPTRGLAPGLYVVRLAAGGTVATQRLSVVR